jgi:hypothetical protein
MNDEIKARLSHALEHAERRGSALESHVSVLKSDVRALLADGGKGEAVLKLEGELAVAMSIIEAMRSELNAPQAECAPREAQPKLTVWYGSLPESNGKTNWTAILHRGDVTEGITIDISEYPDRTRYEADRMRWMIGELADEPWILDYDADKHSGYAAPTPERAQPVGPRTTLNYDGTFDTTCAHCGGNGCFACLKSAAPTPERAPREAQPVAWKDEIIEYLQSSFDSEGITENDSGEELIRLSSAIAAVEEVAGIESFFDAVAAPTPERAPREAQPIYLVSSEGRFWQIVSEPVWVNWQADYRNVLYTAAREVQPVNIEKEDDSEIACISCGLTLGDSRLITSHAERKGRGYITKDAVERAKRVMAAVDTYHERPDGGNRHALRSILMDEFEELLAAPTPERADADTAGVNSDSFEKWWDMERARIQADRPIDKSIAHRGWCAAFAAGASQERADAEKDAARYRFLETQCKAGTYRGIISREAIDAAILAAKENKS